MPVVDGGLPWCKNKNAATITSIATMDSAIFIDVSCGHINARDVSRAGPVMSTAKADGRRDRRRLQGMG